MKKFQIVLILIAFQFHLHESAVQDLCGDAKKNNFIFADDPSGLDRYLYCDEDTNVTYQLSCDNEKFPIFHNDSCWPENALDPTLIVICPALEKPIKYATEGCTDFALCIGSGTVGVGSCTGGLLFDRSSGACVKAEFAPCAESENKNVDCTSNNEKYVVVPGTNCTTYVFCYNDAEFGRWECTDGQVFDISSGTCIDYVDGFECQDGTQTTTTSTDTSTTSTDSTATSSDTTTVSSLFHSHSQKVPSHIPRAKIMWQ